MSVQAPVWRFKIDKCTEILHQHDPGINILEWEYSFTDSLLPGCSNKIDTLPTFNIKEHVQSVQRATVFSSEPIALLDVSWAWPVKSVKYCESLLLSRASFTADLLLRVWRPGSFSQSGLERRSLLQYVLHREREADCKLAGSLLGGLNAATGLNMW